MKLGLMEWRNFQSYRGEGSLDWSSFDIAVFVGPNGAGKSTLIDMVRWALWGTTRDDVDSVITRDAESCEVVLRFWERQQEFRVRSVRARKGGGKTDLSFQMLGPGAHIERLDQKTVPLTREKIRAVIGMTDALFIATACSSQGDAAIFARSDRAQRRQILASILQLGDWEQRAKMARDEARALEIPLAHKEADLQMLQRDAEQIPMLAADLSRIASELEGAEKGRGELDEQATTAQGQRETLLQEREQDRAARAQYDDMVRQRGEANEALTSARRRVEEHEIATSRKGEVDAALERAQKARQEVELLQVLEAQVASIETQRRQIDTERKAALQDHAARVRDIERTIQGKQQRHESTIAQLHKEQDILERQTKVLTEVPCTSLPAVEIAESCPLLKQAHDAESRLEAIGDELDRLEHDEAGPPWAADEVELTTLKAETPAAPFDESLEGLDRQRREIDFSPEALAQARKLAAPLDRLQKEMRAIEGALAQLETWRTRCSEIEQQLGALDQRLSTLATQLGPERKWDEEFASIDAALGRIRQQRGEANRAIQQLQEQRGTTRAKLERAKQAKEGVDALEEELRDMRRRMEVLGLLGNSRDGCFSKAGIPALLMEQAIPDLEATANEMLAELSDGALSVTLESQREVKGELAETLDIMVADSLGSWPYETYSGGEKMRVDLALRMALATLLARRAETRCETLVLDETAAPLDVEGRELFAESLQRVGGRFANIVVITHIAELQDLFPTRILVSKDASGSRLSIGGIQTVA